MTPADRSLLAEVMAEARSLGLAWWERLALILALAFLIVAGKRIWAALPSPTYPGPTPPLTDVPPMDPPSTWDVNVQPNTSPEEPGGA